MPIVQNLEFKIKNIENRKMKKARTVTIERKTTETDINLTLNLDGTAKADIKTPVSFFNHMLTGFARHGLFDLTISATGDTEIDDHHTVEDIGIVLGKAFGDAIGDKKGISRFGSATIPMDEALCSAFVDFSGRPFFDYGTEALAFENNKVKVETDSSVFDLQLIEEFFKAFVNNADITLHIKIERGKNLHHIYEAMFKAVGKALRAATEYDPRISDIPSSKGML